MGTVPSCQRGQSPVARFLPPSAEKTWFALEPGGGDGYNIRVPSRRGRTNRFSARNRIEDEMKKMMVLMVAAFAAMMPLMATPGNDNFADASEITGTQGTLNASNDEATREGGTCLLARSK